MAGSRGSRSPSRQSTRETFAQGRIDHSFSRADSLLIRYTIDEGARGLPTLYSRFSSDQTSRSQWLTIEEERTFSAALLNTARFSYSAVKLGLHVVTEGVGPLRPNEHESPGTIRVYDP